MEEMLIIFVVGLVIGVGATYLFLINKIDEKLGFNATLKENQIYYFSESFVPLDPKNKKNIVTLGRKAMFGHSAHGRDRNYIYYGEGINTFEVGTEYIAQMKDGVLTLIKLSTVTKKK